MIGQIDVGPVTRRSSSSEYRRFAESRPAMAGQDRMTIEEVVRQVLRDEHGDVIRESVRAVARELVEAEVSELIGLSVASAPRTARRIATATGRGAATPVPAGLSCRSQKIRQGSYFPSFLQPRKRSEQALVMVQQAYVGAV